MVNMFLKLRLRDDVARVMVANMLNADYSVHMHGDRQNMYGSFKVPGLSSDDLRKYVKKTALSKIIKTTYSQCQPTNYSFRFDQEGVNSERRKELSNYLLENYPNERYVQMLNCYSFIVMDSGTFLKFDSEIDDLRRRLSWGEEIEHAGVSEVTSDRPFVLHGQKDFTEYFIAAQGFRLDGLGYQYNPKDTGVKNENIVTKIYLPLHVDKKKILETPQLEDLCKVTQTGLYYNEILNILEHIFPIDVESHMPETDLAYRFRVDKCSITQFPLGVSEELLEKRTQSRTFDI